MRLIAGEGSVGGSPTRRGPGSRATPRLATAAVAPDRVTRVVAAAGPGPSEEQPSTEEVLAEVREMADRLLHLDDPAFQAAMAAGIPPDERYFADRPAEAAVFFADLRRALDPPDGFARDTLSWGGTWDVDLSSVTAPVDLLYGDADRMVPVAHGHRLSELIPHATLTVVPGSGHGEVTFGAVDRILALLAG